MKLTTAITIALGIMGISGTIWGAGAAWNSLHAYNTVQDKRIDENEKKQIQAEIYRLTDLKISLVVKYPEGSRPAEIERLIAEYEQRIELLEFELQK